MSTKTEAKHTAGECWYGAGFSADNKVCIYVDGKLHRLANTHQEAKLYCCGWNDARAALRDANVE